MQYGVSCTLCATQVVCLAHPMQITVDMTRYNSGRECDTTRWKLTPAAGPSLPPPGFRVRPVHEARIGISAGSARADEDF